MAAAWLLSAVAMLCLPGRVEAAGGDVSFEQWRADPLGASPARLHEDGRQTADGLAPDCGHRRVPDKPVSLIDAVDYSLCSSPDIAGTWAAIKVQAGALGEARATYLPSLSAIINRQRTRTTYSEPASMPTSVSGYSMSAGLSWRLFDFGGRAANQLSANSLLLAAMAEHDATLQRILAATIQAYFDAQTAYASWQASTLNAANAKETLDSAKRREDKGAVARGDTLRATTAHAKAMLEQSRAHGNFRKSLAVLTFGMGLSSNAPVVLADESDYLPSTNALGQSMRQFAGELENLLDTAQRSHPAIRAARAQWEAAKAVVQATRAEGLPTIDLGVNSFRNGYPGQGLSTSASRVNTVGLAISIPLFDGYAHRYKVRQTRAHEEQKEAALNEVARSISTEVVKTHADVLAGRDNLEVSGQLLEAATEASISARRKYDRGAADILEILQTQNAVADARQERVRCLSEWRSARLRLMASTGILGMGALRDELK